MSWNNTKSRISNFAFSLLFIITLGLSIGFWMFLGKEAIKENVENFKNYLVKEGIELSWSEQDDKLFIKHNNIELNQIKDFKLIKSISYRPSETTGMKFSFESVDDIINKLMFGDPLKEEFSQIKVIVNNMDNEELITHKELASIYEQYHPYKILLCEMDSYIYLNEKNISCPESNHINLNIDTTKQSYTMKINYYKDWGGIASRYLTYSKGGMENKLADFKIASREVKDKFGDDILKLKIEKIQGRTITINGDIKKTIRPLNSEFLLMVDDNKDYIEKDVGEAHYYVAFSTNTILDDFSYIIAQLKNKDTGQSKIKEQPIPLKEAIKPKEPIDEKTNSFENTDNQKIDKVNNESDAENENKSINKESQTTESLKLLPEASKQKETKSIIDEKEITIDNKKDAVKELIKENPKKSGDVKVNKDNPKTEKDPIKP